MKYCLAIGLAVGAFASAALGDEARDARMGWWREAKFGMFIHWGVYAVPAGVYDGKPVKGIGEWIMRNVEIPVGRYREYAADFNPTKYDPEAWAELAHDAGMKYMVITSKHHDGFALFDSKVTDWDIADSTPYGRDLLDPLAKAARSRGLKFGLYYSQAQDWVHPGGAKMSVGDGGGWDASHRGSFDNYLKKIAAPQVEEILTKYQPDVLWWDTPHLMTTERAKPLADLLTLRPGIITNNRLGGAYKGDTETPEQFIPATGYPGRDWETCMTLNDTWGFKSDDHNWKSTETIIRNLVDIVSKGGNYLLNVGPTAQGEIPRESIERLREVGRWMKVNGEAIYGSSASPCRAPQWGRVARGDDGELYLFVFDWPADGKLLVPVNTKPTACRLLAEPGTSFNTKATEDGVEVELTGTAPDPMCSVVVLGIDGAVEEVPFVVRQNAEGQLTLLPGDAKTHREGLRVESIDGSPNLGYWTSPESWAEWPCKLAKRGKFRATIEVAGPKPSRFEIGVGDARQPAETAATGGYSDFQRQDLGSLDLAAGQASISLRPTAGGWNPINVRRIVLTPTE